MNKEKEINLKKDEKKPEQSQDKKEDKTSIFYQDI